MYHIAFGSKDPVVLRLIDSYHEAERAADPNGLQITADLAAEALAAEARKDSPDEVVCQELYTLIGMCQMAMAELNLQEAQNYRGRDEVLVAAQRMLACVTA